MKNKTKVLNLPMKFNPALEKYEPDLPVVKNIKRKINWWIAIMLILGIILTILSIWWGFS